MPSARRSPSFRELPSGRQRPAGGGLGAVAIGRLVTSTAFTLFAAPLLFGLPVDAWRVLRRRRRHGRPATGRPSRRGGGRRDRTSAGQGTASGVFGKAPRRSRRTPDAIPASAGPTGC